MAWAGVIPEVPSFGQALARGVGQGFSKGMGTTADFAQKMMLEKYKKKQNLDLLSQIKSGKSSQPKSFSENFTDEMAKEFTESLPQIEQDLGRELTPQDTDMLWNKYQELKGGTQQNQTKEDPFAEAEAMAAMGFDTPARISAEKEKTRLKEKSKVEAEERGLFGEGAKKFWDRISETRDKLPLLESSLDAQLNSVLSGEVDPWSRGHFADIAKALGAPASLVAPLETPGSKEFKTGLKTYLSSTLKDAFRGATTGREIELAEGLLAQAGATEEGNLASIWLLQSQLMIDKERIRIANDLKKKGVSGYEIPDLVAEQIEPIRKSISSQYFEALESFKKK